MTKCTALQQDETLCGAPGEATEIARDVNVAKTIRRLYIKVGLCAYHRGEGEQQPPTQVPA